MAELEPRNFLQPCLLLLLMEQPDHGYELAARLRPMHDGEGDPGSVYRALRGLERQGLVRSEWSPSDVGPARRTYYITDDGVAGLDDLRRRPAHHPGGGTGLPGALRPARRGGPAGQTGGPR